MSVPVRYSAAANNNNINNSFSGTNLQSAGVVVVGSGFSYYPQGEQYHRQQQQFYEAEKLAYEAQQQQLMQQRSSMLSSSIAPEALPAVTANTSNNSTNYFINHNSNSHNINIYHQTNAPYDINMADEQQTELPGASSSCNLKVGPAQAQSQSSTMAAAVAKANGNGNNNGNAEMRTEWTTMSDEGRYGTPGAAGLEYQKYELEQQQRQQQLHPHELPANNNNNRNSSDQTMEPPSSMDNGTNANTNDSNNNNNSNNSNLKNWEMELDAMSADELYNTLKEYDALQDKYHTVLLLPKESNREVTAGGRDGSAYVLRCLKMWYELPSDVLFSAMSLVDRFLDRMAVKPKHMACMSVASFHLAIKQLGLKPIPADDLVTISQCGCTPGDLERMAGVIANKLGVQLGQAPITSVSYLRIYYALFLNLARDIGGPFLEFYQRLIKLEDLENRLEILLCDVKTTVITPSTLALVLICLHLDFHIKESYTRGSPELKHVFDYILFLQQFMRIPDRVFTCGFSIVSGILSHYNGQNKQPYKQRLVWKLSSRTLRLLRPTNRFSSDLPTIEEGISSNTIDDGCRSRTESLSSEEEEDWPTSPIIPIFEQC